MRRISRTRRVVLAALAVVQMAVPALVAVADAELAIRSRGSVQPHVEDHTRKSCRPVHADDCALCQLLSHSAPQRPDAPVISGADIEHARHRADASQLPSSASRALERTRAPPVG